MKTLLMETGQPKNGMNYVRRFIIEGYHFRNMFIANGENFNFNGVGGNACHCNHRCKDERFSTEDSLEKLQFWVKGASSLCNILQLYFRNSNSHYK